MEFPDLLREILKIRPLLVEAMRASRGALKNELEKERVAEMEKDAQYWRPLVRDLETMRLNRRKK